MAFDYAKAKELGDLSPDCYTPSEQQVALPIMLLGLALSLVGLLVSIANVVGNPIMWVIIILSSVGVIAFMIWIWIAVVKKACKVTIPTVALKK